MSLCKDIEFIKDTPSDELVQYHLKVVFRTYQATFGEVCTGCATKISGYIKRLKTVDIKKVMEKTKSNFTLKTGKLIVFKGQSKGYSNANLTDEVAIKFLKGNENRKALFAKLPENIDALLSDDADEAGATKSLKDYTATELRELYPNAKGRSKDDLIASIEALIKEAVINDDADEAGATTSKTSDEEE